jgi:hypothetical protein
VVLGLRRAEPKPTLKVHVHKRDQKKIYASKDVVISMCLLCGRFFRETLSCVPKALMHVIWQGKRPYLVVKFYQAGLRDYTCRMFIDVSIGPVLQAPRMSKLVRRLYAFVASASSYITSVFSCRMYTLMSHVACTDTTFSLRRW